MNNVIANDDIQEYLNYINNEVNPMRINKKLEALSLNDAFEFLEAITIFSYNFKKRVC